MVDDGTIHGPENAEWNIRGTGNLQEVAASVDHVRV